MEILHRRKFIYYLIFEDVTETRIVTKDEGDFGIYSISTKEIKIPEQAICLEIREDDHTSANVYIPYGLTNSDKFVMNLMGILQKMEITSVYFKYEKLSDMYKWDKLEVLYNHT